MRYFTIFLLIAFGTISHAQVSFDITRTDADAGTQVDIEFTVNNFTDLISFQIPVSWDPEVIRLNSVKNVATLANFTPTDDNFGIQEGINTGSMAVIWESPGFTPRSLPNGTILFTLTFDVIGSSGQSTPVYIDEEWVTVVEFVNGEFEVVPWEQMEGMVNVTGEAADLRIYASNETGQPNGTVCVKIQGDGIVDIGVMQFTLSWNPSFMSFENVPMGTINIPSFNDNNYDIIASEGKMTVSWQSPAGLSRPNGSVLFEVCFRINATSGSSPVSFINDPVAIEFATSGGMLVSHNTTPGLVSVEGEPDCIPQGLTFIFDHYKADVDENICIPFRVFNFNNLTSIQLSIEWDPEVLEFLGINEPQLQELNPETSFNLLNVEDGYVVMVWFTDEGQTVPDFNSIFHICFKVIGELGEMSPLMVNDRGLTSGIEIIDEVGNIITPFFCEGSVTIDPDVEIAINVENTIRPTCPNSTNGRIQIDVIGGTTPYMFTWRNQAGDIVGESQNLTDVGPGTYTVTVIDDNDVTVVSTPINLTSVFNINITENITPPTCRGDADGAISLGVSGNTGTITNYEWSNNTSGTMANSISNVMSGNYMVTISFGEGCIATRTIMLPNGPGPIIQATVDAGIGTITLEVSGGVSPYTYEWSDMNGMQNRTGLAPGMYTVTVTDAVGCSAVGGPYLVGDEDLMIDVVTSNYNDFGISCNGVCDGSIMIIPIGGIGPYTYAWSNNASGDQLNNLCAGVYSVTVTDGDGTTLAQSIELSAPPRLRIEIETYMRSTMDNGSATVTGTGGVAPYNYMWNTEPVTNGPSVNSLPAQIYTVTATDANGCTATRSIDFSRDLEDDCYDNRKVITPNGDGLNDELFITCLQGSENQLDVFDRYGKPVFSARNYDNTWAGTGPDGEVLPDGGYFFVLRVTNAAGVEQTVNGNFTLLRDAR